MEKAALLEECIGFAGEAGEAIMQVYETCDLDTQYKEDNSPLTKADLASHDIIMERLRVLTPHIPILSEEGVSGDLSDGSAPFWLVDPLDGTKEFIKRNGEFTVNIALIENRLPVLGVVYLPAKDVMYVGGKELPARKKVEANDWQSIAVASLPPKEEKVQVIASRSHPDKWVDKWLHESFGKDGFNIFGAGSSLKLCMVAEGLAHFYPRFGRTMEWDIAAGQAVLMAAGGLVTIYDERRAEHLMPLTYGKEGRDNPHFIASCVPLGR